MARDTEKRDEHHRPIVDPVTTTRTRGSGPSDDRETETSHESYAVIGASRVSGSQVLFGSDFLHHGYIQIEVSEAVMMRSLSHDWPFAKKRVIQVMLSEAQWAAFVSNLNSGRGIPCTIDWRIDRPEDPRVPSLPPPQTSHAVFKGEIKKITAFARERLGVLSALIAAARGAGIKAKVAESLDGEVHRVIRALDDSIPFVEKSFGEHTETKIEKAKIEIDAYVTQAVTRVGLDALEARRPLELPKESEK